MIRKALVDEILSGINKVLTDEGLKTWSNVDDPHIDTSLEVWTYANAVRTAISK